MIPLNPDNPNIPVNPDDPDTPVNPDDPNTPINPDDPDTPVNPDDPNTPVNPDDPNTPVDPDDPNTPVNPDDPNTPVNPDDPNTPVDPGDNETEPVKVAPSRAFFVTYGEDNSTKGAYYQYLNEADKVELQKSGVEGGVFSALVTSLKNGVMHAAGAYNNKSAYWRDGVITDLHALIDSGLNASSSTANKIIVIDNQSLVVKGVYHVQTDKANVNKACYWRLNGGEWQFFNLHPTNDDATGSVATLFEVDSNGATHAAGYYYVTNVTNSRAAYWKDGVFTDLHAEIPVSGRNLPTNSNIGQMEITDSGEAVVMGSYRLNNAQKRCYWKNGEFTSLTPVTASTSSINTFTVSADGAVHVSGNFTPLSSGSNTHAAYWKDGVMTDLHNVINNTTIANLMRSQGQEMFITSGGSIIIKGNYRTGTTSSGMLKACYWRLDNGGEWQFFNLHPNETGVQTSGINNQSFIIASDGMVHAGGYYTANNNSLNYRAAYWKDGVLEKLHNLIPESVKAMRSNVSPGTMILTAGGEAVISGQYATTATTANKAGYWKGAEFVDLHSSIPPTYTATRSQIMQTVAAASGNVIARGYFATSNGNKQAYWRDGRFTELARPEGINVNEVKSFAVSEDGIVEAAGNYFVGTLSDNVTRAAYWNNSGEISELHNKIDAGLSPTRSNAQGMYFTDNGSARIITGLYRNETGAAAKDKACYWLLDNGGEWQFFNLHPEGAGKSSVEFLIEESDG